MVKGSAPRLDITVVGATRPKVDGEVGFTAAGSRKAFERPELEPTFDPDLAGGGAKTRAFAARLQLHVGRERVRPLDGVGRRAVGDHAKPAALAGSPG